MAGSGCERANNSSALLSYSTRVIDQSFYKRVLIAKYSKSMGGSSYLGESATLAAEPKSNDVGERLDLGSLLGAACRYERANGPI